MIERMVVPFADKAHFGFKVHTVVFLDGLLHVMDEGDDVIGGGIAHIHNKACVLGADLGTAHGIALKTRFNNEWAGIVAGWTLKGAPCTRKR